MTNLTVAREIALGVAQGGREFSVEIEDERTREEPFGWVFFYRKAEPPQALVGNAPIIVDRVSGAASVTGTGYPIEWFIHAYRELGQDRFDAREWRAFIEREYLAREEADARGKR